jgi:hypothetical protein
MPFDFMPHIFPRHRKHGQSVSGVLSRLGKLRIGAGKSGHVYPARAGLDMSIQVSRPGAERRLFSHWRPNNATERGAENPKHDQESRDFHDGEQADKEARHFTPAFKTGAVR